MRRERRVAQRLDLNDETQTEEFNVGRVRTKRREAGKPFYSVIATENGQKRPFFKGTPAALQDIFNKCFK